MAEVAISCSIQFSFSLILPCVMLCGFFSRLQVRSVQSGHEGHSTDLVWEAHLQGLSGFFLFLRPPLCPLDKQTITEWVNTCQSADIQCGFSGFKWVGSSFMPIMQSVSSQRSSAKCVRTRYRGERYTHTRRPELCVHCGKDVPGGGPSCQAVS